MLWVALQILAAYLLVDLLTRLYHLLTDWGINLPQQVRLFQEHHQSNTMDEVIDWQPLVLAVPLLIFAYWWPIPAIEVFLKWLGWLMVFAQTPHYFAHHPPKGGLIYWLQQLHVFIPPKHHADHHQGEFDRNFCIFSGLNNFWLNPLLAMFAKRPEAT